MLKEYIDILYSIKRKLETEKNMGIKEFLLTDLKDRSVISDWESLQDYCDLKPHVKGFISELKEEIKNCTKCPL